MLYFLSNFKNFMLSKVIEFLFRRKLGFTIVDNYIDKITHTVTMQNMYEVFEISYNRLFKSG